MQNDPDAASPYAYATPYPDLVAERRLGGASEVTIVAVSQPPGHYPDPATEAHVLFMARGRSFRASAEFGAGRVRGWFSPGDMLLAPAGAVADTEVFDACEAIGIAFPTAPLRRLLGEDVPDLTPLAAARFRDPFVAAALERLWSEAEAPDGHSALFGDAAAIALALALIRRAGADARRGRSGPALGPARLAKVLALMRERIEDDLDLATLAAAVGLSPCHFARAFRSATGETPFARFRRIRVEHAAALLRERCAPLAEIALASGFADQTHMTRAFRAVLGTTPGRLRAAMA
ncbi:AraC family transcriptional regulator [Elioraea rosea]|uniref:AraC family transcriptional regulator n=1 Tax=Elioraea rosea TaxID=2492390 RepID=UPI0013156297|nr:AraC family transcriptional regulator [Elioraea rosea]